LSASYKADPAALQEIRLELLDPSPDEKNLKSVDILADILKKKPGLNIDLFYCINRSKAIDSLAYIMALEDFIKYSKASGLSSKNVADSTLIKYLLSKQSPAISGENPELKSLCRSFEGTDKIETKLDSIKTLQINFIINYLSHDREIPAIRFKINAVAPDTIKPSGNWPAFRTYFTAGE
jgi:hypothetical protein